VTSGVEAARRLLQRDLDDLLAAPSGAGAA
jgi:hypothetical protein